MNGLGFLFDNWYLLLVFLYFIYTMVRQQQQRHEGQQKAEQRTPQQEASLEQATPQSQEPRAERTLRRTATTGGWPQPVDGGRTATIDKPVASSSTQASPTEDIGERKSLIELAQQLAADQATEQAKPEKHASMPNRVQRKRQEKHATQTQQQQVARQRPTAQHAAEGMMWAEVFAAPRARRPHASLRRYSRRG